MWELDHKEGWTLKNWCFWTLVLEKILESPLDSKIKPVHPKGTVNVHCKDWCWSWSSIPLATWCEEPTPWKKILTLGKIESRRRRRQRMRWLDSITDSMVMSLSKFHKIVKSRGAWRAAVYGVAKSWTWFSDWNSKCERETVWLWSTEDRSIKETCPRVPSGPPAVHSFNTSVHCPISARRGNSSYPPWKMLVLSLRELVAILPSCLELKTSTLHPKAKIEKRGGFFFFYYCFK